MNARTATTLGCLLLSLSSTGALAADVEKQTAPGAEELVEKAVVRNRLLTLDGRWELGVNIGFSLLSRLTEHYNFHLSVAYNVLESLGLELRLGYALSRHTSLATTIASDFHNNSAKTADDLSDLWQMTASGIVGLRWQPIYGKLGLLAEYPLHFNFYVWLGGGAALFHRESVVICNQKAGAECAQYYEQDQVGPVVSVALGMRFALPALSNRHSIKIEFRDYSYLDSYYVNVNRENAYNPNNPTGGGTLTQAGLTNLVQADIGYAFIF